MTVADSRSLGQAKRHIGGSGVQDEALLGGSSRRDQGVP